MKITIVTGIFPPDIGGPASYVPMMAEELVKLGHIINVICLSDYLEHDDFEYPFNVTRVSRQLFKPYRLTLSIIKIFKLAKQSDVLYINGLSFESTLANWLIRVPTVHKIVGDPTWERARNKGWFLGEIEEYQTAKKNLLLKILDKIKIIPLKYACKVIVPSAYLKNIVVGWGIPTEKVEIVYNAVEPVVSDREIKLPDFDGNTLITICRLVSWKRVDGIIRILPKLCNVRLVIVGEGSLKEELQNLAKELGVLDKVIFLGQVSRSQVFSLLKTANCFILNSTYEGLPHVVLEALLAGVPVVATDVGGTGEVIQNGINGLLIPASNERELFLAVQLILNKSDKAKRFSIEGKNLIAKKFTFSQMVLNTEKILVAVGSFNINNG